MRKGFFNGLLTGGLIAGIMMLFTAPQFKRDRKQIARDTKQVRNRAHRMVKGVKNLAEDWMK